MSLTGPGGARSTDPTTSHEAALLITAKAESHRILLLAEYAAAGTAGLIDDEAGARAGLLHTGYWKRCSDLRNAGVIEPTGDTRVGHAGREQQVCAITPSGSRVMSYRARAISEAYRA